VVTEIEALRQEMTFLDDEIRALRTRIGGAGNAVQAHKLDMLNRLHNRCDRSMAALVKRDGAA